MRARAPGDALVFTKRLGTGVIATALKRGIARDADVAGVHSFHAALEPARLRAMLAFDVHGCTDVTGFGLIGHAREMALGSGVTLEIEVDAVAVPARRARLRAAGRRSRRAQEQPRIRFLRGGDDARASAGDRGAALRSADLGRPADLASRRRRRATGDRWTGAYRIGRVMPREGETDSPDMNNQSSLPSMSTPPPRRARWWTASASTSASTRSGWSFTPPRAWSSSGSCTTAAKTSFSI